MGLAAAKYRGSVNMNGKTAVVTGCNTGIGICTVEDFVRRGAHVVMACRDLEKAENAAQEVRKRIAGVNGVGTIRVVRLDLSSLASVRSCAKTLLESEPQVNLLVNNAGIMMCPEMRTEDGFEMQLGTNHLGHFLLTCLLLPRIRASAPARIVTVSSKAHTFDDIDFSDLNWEKNYNARRAYGRSKLANILFSKVLGERLQGSGVTAYSLHPGVVRTELGRHLDATYFKGVRWMLGSLGRPLLKTPEEGAQTTIYCSLSEDVANETGQYYSDCHKTPPNAAAQDAESAAKLWEESAKLVGLGSWNPFTANDVPEYLLTTPTKDKK